MKSTKHENAAAMEFLGVLSGKLRTDDCEYLGRSATTKPKSGRRTGNESQLVSEIMRELGKYGAVYRMNAGQIRLDDGRMFRGLPAGFSDIMLIRAGGRVCFIEAKVKPNKPTDKQLAFIERMRGLGCAAGVAYSVNEAMQICGLEIK